MSALAHLVQPEVGSQGQGLAVSKKSAPTPTTHFDDPDSGYIKLYRNLMDSHFADNPKYLSTWVHMLMLCTHKPINTLLGRSQKKIRLKPGQFVSGRQQLAKKVGTSEKEMRTIIQFFEQEGMLHRNSSRFGTLFTVLDYPGQSSKADNSFSEEDGQQGPITQDQSPDTLQASHDVVVKPSLIQEKANLGQVIGATEQENKSTEFNKLNSLLPTISQQSVQEPIQTSPQEPCQVSNHQGVSEQQHNNKAQRPEAVIQDNDGKKWATQEDLNNARHMADTVARLQGVDRSPLNDQKLLGWADECRRLRGMKTTSGKTISAQHITTLWNFAHQDSFWQRNLLSPKALRKHWERLAVQYHQRKKPTNRGAKSINSGTGTANHTTGSNNGRTPFINNFDAMNYQDSEQLPDWAKEA